MQGTYGLATLLVILVFALAVMPVLGSPSMYDVVPPKYLLDCDVTCDERVDGNDIIIVAKSYGSAYGTSNWNPAADINPDGRVDMSDLAVVCQFFGMRT